jgi:hypothetical protein
MLTYNASLPSDTLFQRLAQLGARWRPLAVTLTIAVARLACSIDAPPLASTVQASEFDGDYDAGWWAGYDAGVAGAPYNEGGSTSMEYCIGYSTGYVAGEADAQTSGEGGGSSAEDYDNGWWAGYDAGVSGAPYDDGGSSSMDFANGYSAGYSAGQADAETSNSESGEGDYDSGWWDG